MTGRAPTTGGGIVVGEPPPVGVTAGEPGGLADARALQILTTEHWSLLASRSLAYNEAFTRAGMFVTAVTGSIVALAFVVQASGYTPEFRWFALLLLAVDLVLGFGALGRINAIDREDFRCVQGMNRLRHAYVEIAPGLEPYFVTSPNDDVAGVARTYGTVPTSGGMLTSMLHGLATTGVAVAFVEAIVAGAVAALLLVQLGLPSVVVVVGGLFGFVGALAALSLWAARVVDGMLRDIDGSARFPSPAAGAPLGSSERGP